MDKLLGSGRPHTARTADNIDAVNELVLSQEDAPRTHKTTPQIFKYPENWSYLRGL